MNDFFTIAGYLLSGLCGCIIGATTIVIFAMIFSSTASRRYPNKTRKVR